MENNRTKYFEYCFYEVIGKIKYKYCKKYKDFLQLLFNIGYYEKKYECYNVYENKDNVEELFLFYYMKVDLMPKKIKNYFRKQLHYFENKISIERLKKLERKYTGLSISFVFDCFRSDGYNMRYKQEKIKEIFQIKINNMIHNIDPESLSFSDKLTADVFIKSLKHLMRSKFNLLY